MGGGAGGERHLEEPLPDRPAEALDIAVVCGCGIHPAAMVIAPPLAYQTGRSALMRSAKPILRNGVSGRWRA